MQIVSLDMQLYLLDSFYNNSVRWMEGHLFTCPSRRFMHMDCPGCGLQRSYISLLKGNFMDSLHLYPAAIPMIVLFVFLAFHIVYKFRKGANILMWMYIFCASIIMVHYIYKVLTQQIL